MLGVFCLRLACGLICSLLLLSPTQINPRFYRVHFLTALCLTVVAAIFLREMADRWAWIWLGASVTFAFVGALAWSIESSPGGRSLIVLDSLCLAAALGKLSLQAAPEGAGAWNAASEFSSAAVLGTATRAMLM